MSDNSKIIQKKLKECTALLITAGAGMGVDSGLPDFRGNQGFWKAYPLIAKLAISFAKMANPRWFEIKPELAWAFYGHRLNLYRSTIPHQGFSKILDFGKKLPGGYFVYTSNVDGHFQKATFDENRIVECHGSIHFLQCLRPCSSTIWSADGIEIKVKEDTFEAQYPLPQCPHCSGLARPNILMFDDWAWIYHRTEEQAIRLEEWMNWIIKDNHRLVVVEFGAGTAVPTVRHQSEKRAAEANGLLMRINPRESYVPLGHIPISMGAAEGINFLEKLWSS